MKQVTAGCSRLQQIQQVTANKQQLVLGTAGDQQQCKGIRVDFKKASADEELC